MDISILLKWKREEVNDIFKPEKIKDKKMYIFFVLVLFLKLK
jgi:hypothetical protein